MVREVLELKHAKNGKEKNRFSPSSGRFAYSRLSKVVRRSFVAVAAMVVFVTTYAMILPAITISTPNCGIEEHTHADSCYRIEKKLICTNTDEAHVHTDKCYSEQRILACGKEIHVHTDECYAKPTEEPTSENSNAPPGSNPKEKDQMLLNGMDLAALKSEITSQYIDFEEYLASVGGKIESFLYDSNNNLIDTIYEASGQGYTYTLRLSSPYIMPGTYYYALPKGIDVDFASKTGDISNGDSVIGTYQISADSTYILFTFDESASHYQDITGQITLSVSFEETIDASVGKSGWLITPEGTTDGFFHFKITAKIPAAREGLAMRQWRLSDRSEITYQWVHDFAEAENAKNTHVYISYGDVERREIYNIKDVWNNTGEQIAYYVDENSSNKYLYLVNRCTCEESRLCLEKKDGKCHSTLLSAYPGWCTCWSLDENATVDIEYKNAVNGYDGKPILRDQNNMSDTDSDSQTYENNVTLTGRYRDSSSGSGNDSAESGSAGIRDLITKKSRVSVPYSSMFDKKESKKAEADNEYTSEFTITFNKHCTDMSKLDVDGDGNFDDHVTLVDRMESLKYVTGSMKVIAVDAEGNQIELLSGTDFTVDCEQTEKGNDLTIKLYKLGKYVYIITYEAQVFSEPSSSIVEIKNDVMFDIYGNQTFGEEGQNPNPVYRYSRRFAYEEQWDYLKYKVNILKTDYEDDTKTLEGAVFALYSEDGNEVARRTTDSEGKASFATDAAEGLIFKTGTLYYIEEKQAPGGYDLNTLKYWFYFSESSDPVLERRMNERYPGINLTLVQPNADKEYIAEFNITNEKAFELPETGGGGVYPYIFAGGFLIVLSVAGIIFRQRFKRGYRKD